MREDGAIGGRNARPSVSFAFAARHSRGTRTCPAAHTSPATFPSQNAQIMCVSNRYRLRIETPLNHSKQSAANFLPVTQNAKFTPHLFRSHSPIMSAASGAFAREANVSMLSKTPKMSSELHMRDARLSQPIAPPLVALRTMLVVPICAGVLLAFSSGAHALVWGQAPPSIQSETPRSNASASAPVSGRQPDPALSQSKSLLDAGKVIEADRAARQYLAAHPGSADAHFLLGYILFREIQAGASAEESSEGALYHSPNASDEKLRVSNAKASLAEFTEGAKYHDPSAFDLKIVALDYVLFGDYMDADKWLTRSLELNPKDSQGWYYLGRAKYNENRFQQAIQAFENCLKLEPKNVRAEDNLGLSYAGLGRDDEAFAAYQAAIEWQSSDSARNPEPYVDAGVLMLDENRPQDAATFLLQAVEIAPQEPRAHEKLGAAYSQLNQTEKAQSELEKAVELLPQSARLHFMLGQVYRKEGEIAKAKIELDRSAALSGTHSTSEKPDE